MPADWQRTAARPRDYANGRGIDDAIALIASRQRQLLRLQQLLGCGSSERAAQDRAACARLHRLHSGVYATHPPPYSRHQIYLAATYASWRWHGGRRQLNCPPTQSQLDS